MKYSLTIEADTADELNEAIYMLVTEDVPEEAPEEAADVDPHEPTMEAINAAGGNAIITDWVVRQSREGDRLQIHGRVYGKADRPEGGMISINLKYWTNSEEARLNRFMDGAGDTMYFTSNASHNVYIIDIAKKRKEDTDEVPSL